MEKLKDQTECCPKFDPEPWNEKLIEWDNKKFMRDKVCTLFYVPLNFGMVMKRIFRKLDKAGNIRSEGICLSDHTSKWKMDVYLDVDDVVPGADNVTLSGKFLCKVYEGNFKETANWCKDFEAYAQKQTYTISKWYMWYTTCPKCARKYGKNYVVIFGQVG